MATLTTMIPEALEEWATDRFFNRYASLRERTIYTQLLRVDNTNRGFEEAWEVSGLGTFATKSEGAPIKYDDPVQGNRTRISMQTFALGGRVTMEMREDDRWDIVQRLPNDLADSARDHQERLAHNPINDAFTGTTFTGLDGLSLCNTAHTSLKQSATRSNQLSPGVDLSHAGLEDILTLAATLTDEQGRIIHFNPTRLLVAPANRYQAERILETDKQPGSADNDINTMNSSRTGMMPVVSPYLDSDDDWFVLDPERHDVRYFARKDVTTQTSQDPDTLDMKFTAHYRAGVGFWKWEGFFGSQVP